MSRTVSPGQKLIGPFAVITADGNACTTTGTAAEVSSHAPLLAITQYVPASDTVIFCAVDPVDQVYEVPPLAYNVTLPPSQNHVGPLAVKLAFGAGRTIIVTGSDVD